MVILVHIFLKKIGSRSEGESTSGNNLKVTIVHQPTTTQAPFVIVGCYTGSGTGRHCGHGDGGEDHGGAGRYIVVVYLIVNTC